MSAQTETTAIERAQTGLVPTSTPRAIIMRDSLREDTEQRKLLASYVKEHMAEGTDYGVIPGTRDPTLLKPGAEKLVDLYRCAAKYKVLEKIEDWDRGLFHYLFKVTIVSRDTGSLMAEGFGSANSKEGRYRWRNAQLKCPECAKETLLRSKDQPEYFCWKKKGGCGLTFPLAETRIVNQAQGKVENDDIFTLANTILKMAKKRALVDGAIAMARVSDMFAQDLEDLEDLPPAEVVKPQPDQQAAQKTAQAHKVEQPKSTTAPKDPAAARKQARANALWKEVSKYVKKEGFKEWVSIHLGKEKPNQEWTDEDFALLEMALVDMAVAKKERAEVAVQPPAARKPGPIVDMKPGETEAEAEARARAGVAQ